MKILLANPRGFCAGVHRAVDALEQALTTYGPPVYVRHEIIHNKTVVAGFKEKGAVFVDEIAEIPAGAVAMFSAHGVSQQVYDEAAAKNLVAIDATCPLVSKVHAEARRFEAQGYHVLMIGHKGHVEVVGTMGHVSPENISLIETSADAQSVNPPQVTKLAVVTQTTLSVDETSEIIACLNQRFPQLKVPAKKDICYATQNRQDAVKKIAPQVEAFLVVGSKNSSNSNRLAETAKQYGAPEAHLIDHAGEIPAHIKKMPVVGLSSGASAPEHLVQEVVQALGGVVEDISVAEEGLVFQPPALPQV